MIKTILESLSKLDRTELVYALEHEIPKIIKLPSNKFIGVYVTPTDEMQIIEQKGLWAYGIFKGKR